jgi:hypothetical protein
LSTDRQRARLDARDRALAHYDQVELVRGSSYQELLTQLVELDEDVAAMRRAGVERIMSFAFDQVDGLARLH